MRARGLRTLSVLAGAAVLLAGCVARSGQTGSAPDGSAVIFVDRQVAGETAAWVRAQAGHARDGGARKLLEQAREAARQEARANAAALAAALRPQQAAPATGAETAPGTAPADGGSEAADPPSGDGGGNVGERLAEVLRHEHPRPETEPTVDPEHEEYVEDSGTESRGELTCTECS